MIYVSDDYRVKADQHCWVLESRADGKTRDGVHKDVWTPSYHPNFEQIAGKILKEELKTRVNEATLQDSSETVANLQEVMTNLAQELGEKIRKAKD